LRRAQCAHRCVSQGVPEPMTLKRVCLSRSRHRDAADGQANAYGRDHRFKRRRTDSAAADRAGLPPYRRTALGTSVMRRKR